ncbi:TonB-dependent receptor [Campylobacter estrildidarum]|uniref:TonB-dependent receptor n=1 Tax=Campylobacter estrildidarum TaxID=2510189 RepID=A0A4U7BT84_9BACT|nr:TonB-dependent receptor [Campylobacter estrildidarum]TKX31517.1 TonB-dependent receptor [Campylobacter estrildidarum]
MYKNSKLIKIPMLLSFLFIDINAIENNQETNIKLDKVVVSASGFEQDSDSNLRNVIVIEGSDLQKKGFSSLEQALERVSEINFVDFGLGRNVDMRGQGDKSNVAVKVMVDGRSINMLDNSHGTTPINSINLDNVERIEIIPGGGSVLYGNGTRGGVINIITKKQKEDAFSINVKGNGYDQNKLGGNLGIDITKKINKQLSLNLNTEGFNIDGYQKGYNEKGYFINTKAYINPNEYSDLILGYNYFKSKNTSSGYLTKAQIEDNPKQKGDSETISAINRPEITLDYHYYLNNQWEFDLESFWQNQKINYLKDVSIMGFGGINTPVYQDGSNFQDTITGINLKSKYNYKSDSYFVFGYEFANHDAKRTSIIHYDVNIPNMSINHTMTTLMDMNKQSHSIFALDSHEFNDIFSISSGARYEYNLYKTDRNYTSKMIISQNSKNNTEIFNTDDTGDNIAFEITPNLKYSNTGNLYFKYERGFISPSPAQFVNKDQKTQKYYSSNLNSEIFNTFELGMNDFWWDFYGINLTLFYTLSKDEISYLGNPHSESGAFWKYYNIDQTRRIGAELNLNQSFLNDVLLFRQSLTYIDAKISKGINGGKIIPYVSKIKATAGVEYAINSNLNTFLDLTYYSRSKDNGVIDENTGKMSKNAWIKDYMLTDIGLMYFYKKLQIFGGIRNLFDKQYYTYQDSVNDQYLAGNGRNYYLEFKYAF